MSSSSLERNWGPNERLCPQTRVFRYLRVEPHSPLFAVRTDRHVDACQRFHHFLEGLTDVFTPVNIRRYAGSKLHQVVGFAAVCQKAKLPDSDESFRENVQQEPPNELHGFNGALCDFLGFPIPVSGVSTSLALVLGLNSVSAP